MDKGQEGAQSARVRLGHLIETERLRRGMTQRELGERLGVSQATIDRWEKGANPPVRTHWAGIARFLGSTQNEVGQMAGAGRRTTASIDARLDRLEGEIAEIRRLVVRALGER